MYRSKTVRRHPHNLNDNKLNNRSLRGQPLIPRRLDDTLDSLGKGRHISPFEVAAWFRQIMIGKDAVLLTACGTPIPLLQWPRTHQGCRYSLDWYVKSVNEVIKGMDRVLQFPSMP